MFDVIRHQDVLLHHPYESFMPVVEFFRTAAKDPTSSRSKRRFIVWARFAHRSGADSGSRTGKTGCRAGRTKGAVRRGKQHHVGTTAGAGRRARDLWNRRFKNAREDDACHPSGGQRAAAIRPSRHRKLQSDYGTDLHGPLSVYGGPGFWRGCSELFNFLTGYSGQTEYRKLIVAPLGLREHLIRLISREVEHKTAGRPHGYCKVQQSYEPL